MNNKNIKTESPALEKTLSGLDVDKIGVIALDECGVTRVQETASRLLPDVRSIVVFAMEIYPEIVGLTSVGRQMGEASLNDLLDRNAEFLYGRLTKAAYDVAKASHEDGYKALPLPAAGCPLDARFLDAVFSYKHAAELAGIGYLGRSSLLVTPEFGPRVRLSCCLTEAVVRPVEKTGNSSACENCDICIKGCPSKALAEPAGEEPYSINKFACAYFRNQSGGCSECMRLCPVGK
jgi:epoxyqueuosine reductase QueG